MPSFQATQVPLRGINLIEASAGTGKTYSIAILTLRLLIEKGIPLSEILMVTFTKAAVAELEDRIRLFIRQAHIAAQGKTIEDKTIEHIVQQNAQSLGADTVSGRIRAAILQLDETAVMTIHSFCQQSLMQHAFETGMQFQMEPLQDTNELIEKSIQDFWRSEVTPLPPDVLQRISKWFNQENAKEAIKYEQNGKVFELGTLPTQASATVRDLCTQIEEAIQALNRSFNFLVKEFEDCKEEVLSNLEGHVNAKKAILKFYPNHNLFFHAAKEKHQETKYVPKVLEPIFPAFENWLAASKSLDHACIELSAKLYQHLLAHSRRYMQSFKQKNGLITFDDMIVQLHQALQGKQKSKLASAIGESFQAVFIDEFQDTDKLQYEIFRSCFHQGQVVFYIGDPKQSIYAFRKADIHTYFQAKHDVAHEYEMNLNFRSSTAMIEAANHFFSLPDPFHFQDAADRIEYIPVQAPQPNTKACLVYQGNPATALFKRTALNIPLDLAKMIHSLLEGKSWHLEKSGHAMPILPKHIGILVRTNEEGRAIRKALSKRNIPAILIADEKILQSAEATKLLYTLQAIASNSISDVRRALLLGFTPVDFETISKLDNEMAVQYFSAIRQIVEEKGIYQGLQYWLDLFQIRQQVMSVATNTAEKSISNLIQLIELLHKQESRHKRDLTALTHWLQRGVDEEAMEGDEFLQRMESDEQAVTIMTIHKSKGLEFPIVFLPQLSLNLNKQRTFAQYRHPESGVYTFLLKESLSPEAKNWEEDQSIQENRRLLYVALTRAVSGCFLYQKIRNKDNMSEADAHRNNTPSNPSRVLDPFMEHLEQSAHPHYLRLTEPVQVPRVWSNLEETPSAPQPLRAEHFQLAHSNWRKTSYTALAAKHEPIKRGSSQASLTDYDRFTFQILSRGAQTGNLIHHLFEHISFHQNAYWPEAVKRAIQRFDPGKQDSYKDGLLQLLHETLNIPLVVDSNTFSLSNIMPGQKLSELEFDFILPEFDPSQLASLSTETMQIAVQPYPLMQGLLNGKIDLCFEQQGKYYILDWKSNYLGDQLMDYTPDRITEAMNENNYHLQYLLYTVALKKYLTDRIPKFDYARDFGGVIYLFVRGIRNGMNYGVYTNKPALSTIQILEQWWTPSKNP